MVTIVHFICFYFREEVLVLLPLGGYKYPGDWQGYIVGGGILEVLPNLRDYLIFERMFLLFMWEHVFYLG